MYRLPPMLDSLLRRGDHPRMARVQSPWQKAHLTAKWATTLTKVKIRKAGHLPKWQLVDFAGPYGRESRGVVDVLAIRKNHRLEPEGLKRGDLLSMVFIQIKGGAAPWPTAEDLRRLQRLRRHHRAEAVVLAEWKKGRMPRLFRLKDKIPVAQHTSAAWLEVTPAEVFA